MVIYKVTNLINGKIYIGKQKENIDDYLGSGLLINRAVGKYGRDNFKKEIIDTVETVETLNEKEKYWINHYNSTDLTIGYNIGKGGDGGDIFTNHPNKEKIRKNYSKPGNKNGMFGREHKNESIKKISEHKKGQRKGIATWNKGLDIRNYSEGYKNVYSNRKGLYCKSYTFINPQNIEYKVANGFDEFCKGNNLHIGMARHFINKGKIPVPKRKIIKTERLNLIGWEIKKDRYTKWSEKSRRKARLAHIGIVSDEEKIRLRELLKNRCAGEKNINAKIFYVTSPQNEQFVVKGQLPTFCKEHNINVNVMRNFTNKGKVLPTNRKESELRNNTVGWEIKTDNNIVGVYGKSYYKLISPINEEYVLYNGLRNFCYKNDLNYDCLIENVNKGKIKYPVISFTKERINTTGWSIEKINDNTGIS